MTERRQIMTSYRIAAAVLIALTLVSCGVRGDPIRPGTGKGANKAVRIQPGIGGAGTATEKPLTQTTAPQNQDSAPGQAAEEE